MRAGNRSLLRDVAEAIAVDVRALGTMLEPLRTAVRGMAELASGVEAGGRLAGRLETPGGAAVGLATAIVTDGVAPIGRALAEAREVARGELARAKRDLGADRNTIAMLQQLTTTIGDAQFWWVQTSGGLIDAAQSYETLSLDVARRLEGGAPGMTARACGDPDTAAVAGLLVAGGADALYAAVAAEHAERRAKLGIVRDVLRPDELSADAHDASPEPGARPVVVYVPRDNTTPARIDHFNNPDAPAVNSVVPAAVAIVTNDDGEILLIRRTDNDLWALPGGAIDPGESEADAAIREVWEETSIECRLTGDGRLYQDPGHVIEYTSDGEVRPECTHVFEAKPVGGEPTPSPESSEVRWVAPAEALRRPMTLSMFLRIVDHVEGREEPPA